MSRVRHDLLQNRKVFEKSFSPVRRQPAQSLRLSLLRGFPNFDQAGLLQDFEVPVKIPVRQ